MIIRRACCTLIVILTLVVFTGCAADDEEVKEAFASFQFDQRVIAQLPKYDSLVSSILVNHQVFKNAIKENVSYRYIPKVYDIDSYQTLPAGISEEVMANYQKIPADIINGFEVYKDSTVKIYVRTTQANKVLAEMEENLSYFPDHMQVKKRMPPIKDTTLNRNWQYWTRVNVQTMFD